MVRLTWRGDEVYENGLIVFQPGESLLFETRDDIPAELLMNHAFSVEDVASEGEVVEETPESVEEAPDERARGTIPRFTEIPMPEGDTE